MKTEREALRKIAAIADFRIIIRWMRKVGLKLDKSLDTPQGLFEFSVYSDLVQVGEIARDALGIIFPSCPRCGQQNDCEKHGFHPELTDKWAIRRDMAARMADRASVSKTREPGSGKGGGK